MLFLLQPFDFLLPSPSPKASFQPCNLCIECPDLKVQTQCLQLRQHSIDHGNLFVISFPLSVCVTNHIKKYLESKCVANLLLHEVMHRTRLHQFSRPNLAFPSGSGAWGRETVSVPFMSRKINGFALNKCRGLEEELRTTCFLLP